jgi:hypothetical protein
MKQILFRQPFAIPHPRLTGAVVLVLVLLGLRSILQPSQSTLEQRAGAEHLAFDLPAITHMDPDPRKAFPNSLGKILTSGFDMSGSHVTVLTWADVDRANLKLLGAVLNVPTAFFAGHATFFGCDQASYLHGQCRFDLDFSSGTLQIVNTQPSIAHNYKTSEVGIGASHHL